MNDSPLGYRPRQGQNGNLLGARLHQDPAALVDRRSRGVDVIHQEYRFPVQRGCGLNRKCAPYVFPALFFRELSLRRRLFVANEDKWIHRQTISAAHLSRQQNRLVKASPTQSFGMQRNGNDRIGAALV